MTPDRQEEHARYAEWDAAYVLGALSAVERRDFEEHLTVCPECAANIAALAGMPGLLSRVPRDDGLALLDPPTGTVQAGAVPAGEVPASLLPRLELAAWRDRRRRRVGAWALAGVAAAAGVVGALAVPQLLDGWDGAPGEAVVTELAAESGIPLTATVELTATDGGTRIDMICSYPYGTGDGTERSYDLVVIDAAGDVERVSTWTSRSGSTVELSTTIDTAASDIRTVQVRGTESGNVLLAADLGA